MPLLQLVPLVPLVVQKAWAVGIRECLPKLTVESSDVPKQHREDLVMECFNIVVEELPISGVKWSSKSSTKCRTLGV